MKIKTGDKVKILAGKDRGKNGKVIQVLPGLHRVVVENVNILVKHTKPRRQGENGQKIELPNPLHISNVELICPKCNKQTRISYKILKDKKKVRVCRKCKETF